MLHIVREFFRNVFKRRERSFLEVNYTLLSFEFHGNSVEHLGCTQGLKINHTQNSLLKVRWVILPLLVPDKLYQNRVDISGEITIRSFLSLLIKMANYQAEFCHLLIKLNSNSFLQTHEEDKLSIYVNHK